MDGRRRGKREEGGGAARKHRIRWRMSGLTRDEVVEPVMRDLRHKRGHDK